MLVAGNWISLSPHRQRLPDCVRSGISAELSNREIREPGTQRYYKLGKILLMVLLLLVVWRANGFATAHEKWRILSKKLKKTFLVAQNFVKNPKTPTGVWRDNAALRNDHKKSKK